MVNDVKTNGVVYEVQRPQGGEKRTVHRNMLLPCEMLELELEHAPQGSAATMPVTTRSQRAKSASSRAVTTTPARIRSRSRSKINETRQDSSSESGSGEDDEPPNDIDMFQRATAEEQLRSTAPVEECANGTTPAAVALETDEELEWRSDEEDAAGEDLLDAEYGESPARRQESSLEGEEDAEQYDRTAVQDMLANCFGDTSNEDAQTFTGFDADSRDEVRIPDVQDQQDASDAFGDGLAVNASVTEHVQTFAGSDADIRDGVPIPDVQDRKDASDAFGDDAAADAEAAETEEASTACGDSRRSRRKSRPPERYNYFKMEGEPMVTNEPVRQIETGDVLTNASSVQAGLGESWEEEQLGLVNWIQRKANDWSISLF